MDNVVETAELHPLSTLTSETLSSRARRAILQALVNGHYEPGQRLNEVEIAAALGISRGPVRESIQGLASEGFLEVVPHRGAIVKQFSQAEIAALYELRRVLEGAGARFAAERATPGEIAMMKEVLDSALAAADSEDPAPYTPELDFHVRVMRAAHSEFVRAAAVDVNAKLLLARARSGQIRQRAHQAHEEHLEIVHAIEQGDAALAERLMHDHLLTSQQHAATVLGVTSEGHA